ncbi:hypothetical protein JCM5353_001635 [Sporobolomyces roseus]
MTSVPLDSKTSPLQIDHFSSLPNELLDTVFEYACIDSLPSHPLSKRLLPFFEKHLYRRVSLTSLASFTRFVAHFPRARHTAQLVHDLTLPTVPDDLRAGFEAQLPQFLSLLPNLMHLIVPFSPPLVTTIHHANSTEPNLSRLQHLSTSIPLEPHDRFDLDKLAQFVSLPALKRLKIYDWQSYNDGHVYRSPTTRLPQVTELEIEGEAADVETIKSVLDLCPSLLHLVVNCTYETSPEFGDRLPLLPATLHSLRLHSTYPAQDPVDSIFPRLSQLRVLTLAEGTYSPTIHSTLQQLPLLVEVRLGSGTVDPVGFESLVSGASRLPDLKLLKFNYDVGHCGSKISRPSSCDAFDANVELGRCRVGMADWSFPFRDGYRIDAPSFKHLIQVATENNVEVQGTGLDTLETVTMYHLEANNRAILFTYVHHFLDQLRNVRLDAARDGVALPPLDLDSLDLSRLEIVEMDLPERDWYMLSLRNKVRRRGRDEGKERE